MFVGALDRVENGESILWFIKKVWHKIIAEVPEAKLVVVGAHPSQELQALAGKDILITGFVEDLLPYYKEASVFMAPILTGAGVKFKVLQALAFGLPVVTTAVGADSRIGLVGASLPSELARNGSSRRVRPSSAGSHPAGGTNRQAGSWISPNSNADLHLDLNTVAGDEPVPPGGPPLAGSSGPELLALLWGQQCLPW